MTDFEGLKPRAVLVFDSGDKRFYASLENNGSAKTLLKKLDQSSPLTVSMRGHGVNEYAFDLPWELPMSDAPVTVKQGDIILYNSSLVTVYCGSQTRDFESLTRIGSVSRERMLEAIGGGEATVSIYLEWSE